VVVTAYFQYYGLSDHITRQPHRQCDKLIKGKVAIFGQDSFGGLV